VPSVLSSGAILSDEWSRVQSGIAHRSAAFGDEQTGGGADGAADRADVSVAQRCGLEPRRNDGHRQDDRAEADQR
jgi:hypothetical protein